MQDPIPASMDLDGNYFDLKLNFSGIEETMILEMYKNMSYGNDSSESTLTRNLLTYYIMGIGGMSLCCFGMVGNILSLVVLTRRCMNSSTYSYLTSLAVCDMLFLLFTMIILVKDTEKPPNNQYDDSRVYWYMFPYIHPIAFTFQVTSIWLTLAFTVDRYIMICHPFKAERFCSTSRARKVIAGIYLLGILFNIPKFFEYRTVVVDVDANFSKIGIFVTAFGDSYIFRILFHTWLYLIFICGIPFIALAVLNSFLMHAVSQSRKRGREINVADRKRNDTTIMLIGVVVIFFLCQTPALISRMIWTFKPNDAFYYIPFHILNEVGNLLIVVNSSINIVPYYFFGKKFRREFWRHFCCCLLNKDALRKISRDVSVSMLPHRPSSFVTQHSVMVDLNQGPLKSESRLRVGRYFKKSPKRKTSEDCSSKEQSYDQCEPLHKGTSEINRNYQGTKSTNGHLVTSNHDQTNEFLTLKNGMDMCKDELKIAHVDCQESDDADLPKGKKRFCRPSQTELLPRTTNQGKKGKNNESHL